MDRLLVHSCSGVRTDPFIYAVHRRSSPCPPLCLSLEGYAETTPLISFEKLRNWPWKLNATNRQFNSADDCFPLGDSLDEDVENRALIRRHNIEGCTSIVPHVSSLEPLSKDMAMGLVLRAASGTGWTTGSGLEGPSSSFDLRKDEIDSDDCYQRWPWLSKSPRRRMRVAFTCNVCGERTTRAINPHAYTDGTVFVQCAGCNIFHKLVDNLNLFHELKGRIFPGYGASGFPDHQPYDFLGLDDR